MKRIGVHTGRAYDIGIETGLLPRCGALTAAVKPPCRTIICCDDTVAGLYGEAVANSYAQAGFEVSRFSFPAGERSKRMVTLTALLERMGEVRLDRSDLLVALGGGVVGDLGGFAAAVYRRGIDYVQIPTTVLAAVDSSVGGKTAVDLDCGKNMAGCFWQPIRVLCDPGTFETLPDDTYASGMAEVIKYGAVFGGRPWELPVEEMVARCCELKRDVVEADERERGNRMLLNFGHTIGHAVELASGYAVPHGQAVAIGMVAMARAAEVEGQAPAGSAQRIVAICRQFGLPTQTDIAPAAIKAAARADKKCSGGGVTVVIFDKLVKLTMTELDRYIEEGLT